MPEQIDPVTLKIDILGERCTLSIYRNGDNIVFDMNPTDPDDGYTGGSVVANLKDLMPKLDLITK